jgi:hypothetical protein
MPSTIPTRFRIVIAGLVLASLWGIKLLPGWTDPFILLLKGAALAGSLIWLRMAWTGEIPPKYLREIKFRGSTQAAPQPHDLQG